MPEPPRIPLPVLARAMAALTLDAHGYYRASTQDFVTDLASFLPFSQRPEAHDFGHLVVGSQAAKHVLRETYSVHLTRQRARRRGKSCDTYTLELLTDAAA